MPREHRSKATIHIVLDDDDVGIQRRREIVLLREPRLPEPNDGVSRLLPAPVTENGGDVVDGVESEGVVPGVAFVDQGLDVVAVEGAAAEAELHPEIGLRRAVDAGGVGVESGPPLVVGAVVGGAGSPTAAVGGWWRTVKIVAARGGIRVGGFLHEEAIAMKP